MIELSDFHGYKFTAIIIKTRCVGTIQVEAAGVYLCQDKIEGGESEYKHGHKYSYYVGSGSEENVKKYTVRDINIIPK